MNILGMYIYFILLDNTQKNELLQAQMRCLNILAMSHSDTLCDRSSHLPRIVQHHYLSITCFHSIMSHCDEPHHPALWPLQHNTRMTTDRGDHQTTLYDKGCQDKNE